MSRFARVTIGLFLLLVFATAGCGGSPSTGGGAAGEKTTTPPPRPGEDIMKEAMEKIQQKGKAIPGLPKTPSKRG